MKIDPTKDYRGMMVYATMPFQPIFAKSFQPTALEMRIDLLKAQIQAKTDKVYTPVNLEYQRRLRESAQLKRRPRPC